MAIERRHRDSDSKIVQAAQEYVDYMKNRQAASNDPADFLQRARDDIAAYKKMAHEFGKFSKSDSSERSANHRLANMEKAYDILKDAQVLTGVEQEQLGRRVAKQADKLENIQLKASPDFNSDAMEKESVKQFVAEARNDLYERVEEATRPLPQVPDDQYDDYGPLPQPSEEAQIAAIEAQPLPPLPADPEANMPAPQPPPPIPEFPQEANVAAPQEPKPIVPEMFADENGPAPAVPKESYVAAINMARTSAYEALQANRERKSSRAEQQAPVEQAQTAAQSIASVTYPEPLEPLTKTQDIPRSVTHDQIGTLNDPTMKDAADYSDEAPKPVVNAQAASSSNQAQAKSGPKGFVEPSSVKSKDNAQSDKQYQHNTGVMHLKSAEFKDFKTAMNPAKSKAQASEVLADNTVLPSSGKKF